MTDTNSEVEHGIVIEFNEKKMIGKLEVDYEIIYFRLDFARPCYIKSGEVVFSKLEPENIKGWIPKVNDSLVFIRSTGKMGRPRAFPWDFESNEIQAWQEYAEDQLPSSCCGHLNGEHSGGQCQHTGCHCGDPDYENEQDELTQVWYTEEPGGHNYYE